MFRKVLLVGCAPAELWGDNPAPWERVDAFYYPDVRDLTVHKEFRDVGDLEACRDWAFGLADMHGDLDMRRSTYECGIGPRKRSDFGGITVYRRTVQ